MIHKLEGALVVRLCETVSIRETVGIKLNNK